MNFMLSEDDILYCEALINNLNKLIDCSTNYLSELFANKKK